MGDGGWREISGLCHGVVDAPLHPTDGLGCREKAADGGWLGFLAFKIILREKTLFFLRGEKMARHGEEVRSHGGAHWKG